ncbi:MAG: glycosyltransferase family 2 protein, partial [Chlorobiota bacterium]
EAELSQQQDKRKRWFKEKLYTHIPLFFRPFLYFIYRYIFKLGFLDGIPGLIWHFLQGFWYRFLVDAKIYDIERRAKKENKSIPEVIRENYGIEV